MIRAEGVRLRRQGPGRGPVEALAGVSLGVGPGDLAVVLGRSGAGKTTLLEVLAGLLAPDAGEVTLRAAAGRWSWGPRRPAGPDARRRIGLLFQFPERQLFGVTALDDVAWGLGLGAKGIAEASLERVELPSALWRVPLRRLSRGEKRRVALAGVLARKAEVLLLDEPAVGLDPTGQALLWREVDAYRRERGAAVVVATHWPESFLGFADHVLCLAAGRPLYGGAPEGLLDAAAQDRELSGLLPFALRLRIALRRGAQRGDLAEPWGAAAARWCSEEDARSAGNTPPLPSRGDPAEKRRAASPAWQATPAWHRRHRPRP